MKIAIVIHHHHLGVLVLAEGGSLCDTRYGVVVMKCLIGDTKLLNWINVSYI